MTVDAEVSYTENEREVSSTVFSESVPSDVPTAESEPTDVLLASGAETSSVEPFPNCIAGCAAATGSSDTASRVDSATIVSTIKINLFFFIP